MKRPRILVTRTRKQASALAAQLETMGAEPILIPMIEIVEPSSFHALDDALAHSSRNASHYDWLVFTSANAVEALAQRAGGQNIDLRPKLVAAIGPATAKAVEQAGFLPRTASILLPPRFVAESLAESLLEAAAGSSQHFLLVRAEEARDVVPASLTAAGHRVSIAAAYRNRTPPETLPQLMQIFSEVSAWPELITFTSSSTARNLAEILGSIGQTIPAGIALASVGPITSATLRDLGYEPTFEAAEPTIESLVLSIAHHLKLT